MLKNQCKNFNKISTTNNGIFQGIYMNYKCILTFVEIQLLNIKVTYREKRYTAMDRKGQDVNAQYHIINRCNQGMYTLGYGLRSIRILYA